MYPLGQCREPWEKVILNPFIRSQRMTFDVHVCHRVCSGLTMKEHARTGVGLVGQPAQAIQGQRFAPRQTPSQPLRGDTEDRFLAVELDDYFAVGPP